MAVSSGLEKVERLVAQLEDALDSEDREKDARAILRQVLVARLPNSPESGSVADAIEALAAQGDAMQSLEAATLLRCLARDAMVSSAREASIERPVVTIVERALPELASFCGAAQKRQTYEKYEVLKTVHGRVDETLAPFVNVPADLDAVLGARQLLARTLNSPLLKAYCAPSHLAQIRAGFEVVNNKLARLLKDTASLPANMMDCKQAIGDQLAYCEAHSNFLTKRYFATYLAIADAALEKFLTSVRGRFKAQIVPRLSDGGILQKRYPFREAGRQIKLSIPLRNLGPGIASNVTVRIEADPERFLFANEELLLGSVAAGDFSAVFNGEVMTETDAVVFLLSVKWDETGGPERQEVEFMATANAQRSDIDWQAQTYRRPYSTDVAKGDTFVGRVDKVQALGNKILRTPMESFYVTGQKRVGKTSLALAAVAFAKEHAAEPGIESKYLLWGAIANADPAASLRELGTHIAEFMIDSFPSGVQTPALSFDGSIAALTRLADIAAKVRPGLKYVIVIDEFDEIHPELYQHGKEAGLKPAALLFLDDLVASGRSLARNLSRFVSANEALLREMTIPVTAMALAVTPDGDEMVRDAMGVFDWLQFDLRYVDIVGPREQAFPEDLGIWTSQDEKERAKALCRDLGALIYPHNPFGFGDQGLLVSFPVNCPNNTLPILHSPSRAEASRSWHPLFPRAIH